MTTKPHASMLPLRQLALQLADTELAEHRSESTSWASLDAEGLKYALIPVALEFLYNGETGKRKALVELLKAISEYETDPSIAEQKIKHLSSKYGIENKKYWDEVPDYSIEDKLLHIILDKKRRPEFYYHVENLSEFLDEDLQAAFRHALGSC